MRRLPAPGCAEFRCTAVSERIEERKRMNERIVPADAEFWTRAQCHLLKYGGEFVDFVPVRAGGAFLYDDAGRCVLDFTSGPDERDARPFASRDGRNSARRHRAARSPVLLDAEPACGDARQDVEFGRKLMLEPIVESRSMPSNCHLRCSIRKAAPGATRRRRRSYGPTARRSRGSTAPANSARSTALYQGIGNIGECLAFGRFSGGPRRPKRPGHSRCGERGGRS
jgi:hypothetical protein